MSTGKHPSTGQRDQEVTFLCGQATWTRATYCCLFCLPPPPFLLCLPSLPLAPRSLYKREQQFTDYKCWPTDRACNSKCVALRCSCSNPVCKPM